MDGVSDMHFFLLNLQWIITYLPNRGDHTNTDSCETILIN